jgi:drug/metabolite transporter (DMT)-like permease
LYPVGLQARSAAEYDGILLHLYALAGMLGISFSAVLVRLAAVSPVTATFYRAAYAVPVLTALWAVSRRDDHRPVPARLLAGTSGVMLAADLALWHQSIAFIGVGLATVIANVQVVFVALGAWALHGERPSARGAAIVGGILCGLALTSGLAQADAYGSSPILGTAFGVFAGGCYAGFLLAFRAANRLLAPTAGPLLDATLGVLAGALMVSPFDSAFSLAAPVQSHIWLATLALVSQVVGWLLIATALPRLPATETSALLLLQPVFTLLWGLLFFAEHLSSLQWLGAVLVIAGVAMLSRLAATTRA